MNEIELGPASVLVMSTIAYLVYFYGARSEWLLGLAADPDPEVALARRVIYGRYLGAVSLGSLGLFTLLGGAGVPGLGIPAALPTAKFLGLVALVVLPVVALSSRQKKSWATYPPLRWTVWDRRRVLMNVLSWGAYLFGYELYFRGVLIFTLVPIAGDLIGVAIVTVIYVIVHLDKPASEAIGTLPMGFVFGYAALIAGSFLPVFVAHWVIALTSDFFAARANPAIAWRSISGSS